MCTRSRVTLSPLVATSYVLAYPLMEGTSGIGALEHFVFRYAYRPEPDWGTFRHFGLQGARILALSQLQDIVFVTSWAGFGADTMLLALALLMAIFVAGLVPFLAKPYSELPLYLQAGARMRQGEPIYRTDERPFTYPPLFAVPFVPLSLLPTPVQRPIWYTINFAALAVIVARLRRRIAPLVN